MERSFRAFRFAGITGVVCLLSLGAAAQGQGGDVIIPIDRPPIELPLPYGYLVWEQPPIELDALSKTPLFCGWDEPAYVEEIPNATESSTCRPADDFRCLGSMPITSIHWWGSYHEWQQSVPPPSGPDAWRITFFGNTPADEFNPYSRPGILLQEFEVKPSRVSAKWVAFDHFPDKPSDSCFQYSLALEDTEYFWPSHHEGDIFWIGIAAVYKTQKPAYVWGWKTRPAVWMDGAVETASQYSTTPLGPISAITILPVEGPDGCGQKAKYDMTFALDTDPLWVKWEQPFTGLRDWPYYEDELSMAKGLGASSIAFKWQPPPDLSDSGLDVDATAGTVKTWLPQILADDYECALSGPVTQIDLWGSWYGDVLPGSDPNNVTFTLSIRADVPALSPTGYSQPGKILWTKTFGKGQFTVQPGTSALQGYFSPCTDQYVRNNHKRSFKYTFQIDRSEAFVQTGTSKEPVIYWLSVQARTPPMSSSSNTIRFGWKTSASIWNDDAVWISAEERYAGTWQRLRYPAGHPRAGEHTALAFAILTSDESTFEVIERQVADDWKCEQPMPVVAATWWGSYLGYTEKACECNTLAKPVKPDYFLLSIWSDVPVPRLARLGSFSHPGEKLWEYKAYEYDELLVGSDKEPEPPAPAGREPVFRYSVKLPPDKWFTQEQGTNVYWFSVVAVYKHPKEANYPWGWTNHGHTFNDAAVAGSEVTDTSGKKTWTWQPLKDETGVSEDMSFVLFQQAQILGPPPIMP